MKPATTDMEKSDFRVRHSASQSRVWGPSIMSSAISRFLFFSGVCSIALVALLYAAVVDRLTPWQDELFVVSAGLSIARSQPPIESVIALYPQSDSPIKFYGPVSFEAAARLIRIFGPSMGPWRLACFGGVIFNLLIAVRLVRLGGGNEWAQLLTGMVLALSGFAAAMQPGRWDFVTSGLFLSGLLLLLIGIGAQGSGLLLRVALAGLLIGAALASTPRALTLTLAAAVTASLVALAFSTIRKKLLFGAFGTATLAVLTQNLLLFPWGLNSLSWYKYVRNSTRQDPHNATPVTGTGGWGLDLQNHKTLIFVTGCLFAAALCSVLPRLGSLRVRPNFVFRVFLASFAVTNLLLMLLLTRGALGLSSFWLTPVLVALMCWLDGGPVSENKSGALAAALISVALLVLVFQAARPVSAVLLTWHRRSTASLSEFVRQNVPKGAAVYGPTSGYFYPVELADRRYLYLYEQEREVIPWLPANPHPDPSIPVNEELDEQSCAQPTYVMWPIDDPQHHSLGEPMPVTLEARLGPKISELRQPPLTKWKESSLEDLGAITGKYGFPDIAIFQIRKPEVCGKS
jgi:hypothetical protein